MHSLFTDRYHSHEFCLKAVNEDLFKDFINLFNNYKGLTPDDTNLYFEQGGDIHDYCTACMRGCGDYETISVGRIIGEYACDHGDHGDHKFLDILVKHNYDLTPIMFYATERDCINTVMYCIFKNKDYVNAFGHRGKTPLYDAITNVSLPMVYLLLDYGADPSLTFSVAQTNYLDHALWVWEHYQHSVFWYEEVKTKIVKLIIDRGTKVTSIENLSEAQYKLLKSLDNTY